jgi:alpha-1,2-mannosyltransferase
MVNSSWTSAHIQQLWWSLKEPALVYPPCDTTDLQLLPLDRKLKHLYLVSVQQFRPEKNHRLQLEAFALARQRAAGGRDGGLVGMVGGR